jgi:hypothetical protein
MANSAKMEGRPAGASEGARRATGEAPAGRTPDRGRFSAQRKAGAVSRSLVHEARGLVWHALWQASGLLPYPHRCIVARAIQAGPTTF